MAESTANGEAATPAVEQQQPQVEGETTPAPVPAPASDAPAKPASASTAGPANKNTGSSSRCRHWARGHCSMGKTCKFAHSGEAGTGPVPPRPMRSRAFGHPYPQSQHPYGMHRQMMPPPYMMRGGYGAYPRRPMGRPQPPSADHASRTANSSACRHWQRGYCQQGDACKFSHAGPPGQGGVENDCRHWLRGGSCQMGDTCKFKHDPAKTGTGEGGPKPKAQCRHFAKGYCSLGDTCHFAHGNSVVVQRIGMQQPEYPPAQPGWAAPGAYDYQAYGAAAYGAPTPGYGAPAAYAAHPAPAAAAAPAAHAYGYNPYNGQPAAAAAPAAAPHAHHQAYGGYEQQAQHPAAAYGQQPQEGYPYAR